MHITAASIVMQARRLAAVILFSAACMPACRADFDTAYTAYLAGNRGALVDDLQAIVASRRVDEFEVWRRAMMQRLPPFTRRVAREDAQKVLQILANGLHAAKQAESLVLLVPLMYRFEFEDDVYKTYELAAQLDHVPAIIFLANLAGVRGDRAAHLALYEKAATHGHPRAMHVTACAYLGDFLEVGRRIKISFPLSTPHFIFGCSLLSTTLDEKRSFEWFRKAALAEHGSETSHPLGWMHFRGIGTSVDYEKAFQIFMRIARRMHPDLGSNACFGPFAAALEEMYRLGLGTDKNERSAEYFKTRQVCLPPEITK